jgi:four helix bundle protein
MKTPPQHSLRVYGTALELLDEVRGCRISSSHLRDQADRAAERVCLNIGEACGRATRADKARVLAIARGEVVEACVAIELAWKRGQIDDARWERIAALASHVYAVLTKLCR